MLAYYEPVKHWLATKMGTKASANTNQAMRPLGSTRNPSDAHLIDTMRLSMQPSHSLREKIRAIRQWDKDDTRVKKIHNRMARDCVRGGVVLDWSGPDHEKINRLYDDFQTRLKLNDIAKLKSDARQFCVQGNLALQWVFDPVAKCVARCLSMPVDTLVPNTTTTGEIASPLAAYFQVDPITGKTLATFAQWQLSIVRLDPDNYDDAGSLGRPYLDAVETSLQQLKMTEEDLVIRRRMRAGLKNLFSLKGANEDHLEKFDNQLKTKMGDIAADYSTNSDATVHSVGGDANLDQIGDISHLLNTVFAGAPGPKSLFGYTEETSRDILEDLKKDYYEEIDELQDTIAVAYHQGFILELLLHGIDPAAHEFQVKFMERRTESRNQKADLGLKLQAMGASMKTVFKTAGLNAEAEQKLLADERKKGITQNKDNDPDGAHDSNVGNKPTLTITEKNAKKNESATDISN